MNTATPGRLDEGAHPAAGSAVSAGSIGAALLQVRSLGLSLPDLPNKPFFGAAPLKRILHNVSFALDTGGTLGVIGESGSGKSTLARALTMLMPPQAGTVLFQGREVRAFTAAELVAYRSQVQLIFQDPMSSLNPRRRVGAIVTQPLRALGQLADRDDATRQAAQLLERVGLSPQLASRYPHELSGGQRQRVGIARALALRPLALIADEVTSGLDVSAQARIVALLDELRRDSGLALIFISHDLSLVRSLCDQVLILRQGEVVEQGASEQIFAQPQHLYTCELLDAIPLPEPDPGWLERAGVHA
jgi:ABC-type oligopeptide transport system ATPase subunit